MASFVLIPGAGGSRWYWHRVAPLLAAAGHDVITPDLPASDPSARLATYVDTVLDAVGAADELVVVGQSLGGLVAPIVAERGGAQLLVLVAAMIPRSGETGGQWWAATGQPEAAARAALADGRAPESVHDPIATFLHDLPEDVRAEALRRPIEQTDGPFLDPWPLPSWPDVPTRVIAARHDRLFPLAFLQGLSRARLGVEPDVIDTGHLPALVDPAGLAGLLTGYLEPDA